MSIATQISRLTGLRNSIRTKLIALGVISESSADLEDCYNGINGITGKGAATYNSSHSAQTISAGTYLSGAQTILPVVTDGINASNVKDGAVITVGDTADTDRLISVTGTFTDSTTVSTGQTAAAEGQILEGYSAWVDGAEVKGSIGSGTSSDLTASGATVTVPAGYYPNGASKTIASGTATTPATTITTNPTITVSAAGLITASYNGSKSVTPTVSAGYVSSGTAGTISTTGSATKQLDTRAAATIYPSATDQSIGKDQYLTGDQTIKAVTTTNLAAANVKTGVTVKVGDVADDDRVTSVTGTFTAANTVSTGQSAATQDEILSGYSAWVAGDEIKGSIQSIAATAYYPSSTYQEIPSRKYLSGVQTIYPVSTNLIAGVIKDGFTAKIGDIYQQDRVTSITGTFTDASTVSSGQTAADRGQILKGYSAWVDGAEVKGSINTKTSSDLIASGATVTVPAGYYASQATKSVATGTVTAPASITGTSATASVENGLLKLSKTISVTPSVTTAGYVSSGTAGNTNVSLSSGVPIKDATTYTPTQSDRTIASGTYLAGDITIKGESNLKAANIASGVTIFGITGTHVGGYDTSNATATAADIATGKTAYISSGKVTGTYKPYLTFTNKNVNASWLILVAENAIDTGEVGTMTVGEPWRDIYRYRAAISCTGVTSDMFAYAEFNEAGSTYGYFAPRVDSYDGGIYVYAAAQKTTYISTLTCYKRS